MSLETRQLSSRKFSPFFSEFKNRQQEEAFLAYETGGNYQSSRLVFLFLGILFFLFIIPDYFLTQNKTIFCLILAIRGSFLLLAVLLFFMLGKERNPRTVGRWLFYYKIIVSAAFLTIFYYYETPSFHIQSYGVIALIIVFFVVVGRWIDTVCVSALLGIGFMLIAAYRFTALPSKEMAAVAVYITLILLLNAVFSYQINCYKRMQFIYNQELKLASEIDTLTGIYLKSKFYTEMRKWMELASRHDHPLSLVLFDVDSLKTINDVYGHLAGEQVLSTLPRIVRNEIRQSDVFARWGGDEFVILLPHTGRAQAVDLAERIRDLIASHRFALVGQISCSFGVAEYKKGEDIDSFLARADRKLYQAKSAGKNRVM